MILLNEIKMAGNAMMLMGAMALIKQRRDTAIEMAKHGIGRAQVVGSDIKITEGYCEKTTDTETLVEVIDSVYLELERKVNTFERNPDTYRSLNKTQMSMRMTCTNDHYFLSIEELARLISVKFDMEQVVSTSLFLNPSKRD